MSFITTLVLLTFCNLKSDADLERGIVELKNGDTPSAVRHLSAAHARGNRGATKRLFRVYALGLGIQPDYAHAKEFLRYLTRRDARREVEAVIVAYDEGHYSAASPAAAEYWRQVLRSFDAE